MTTYKLHWQDFPLTYNLEEREARNICTIDSKGFIEVVSDYEKPLQYSVCDFYCPSQKKELDDNEKCFQQETSSFCYYPIETNLIKVFS